MGLLDSLRSKELVGTVSVAVGESEKLSEAKIRLNESHGETLNLFKHLCFGFEDCTFLLGSESNEDVYAELRTQMQETLQDIFQAAVAIAMTEERFTAEFFHIAKHIVPSLACKPDFEYESHLYKQGETYSCDIRRPQPIAPVIGTRPTQRHAAVFALFNHLLKKAAHQYEPQSHDLMRIAAGIQLLENAYDQMGGFREMPLFRSEHREKLPNMVIKATVGISDSQLMDFRRQVQEASGN